MEKNKFFFNKTKKEFNISEKYLKKILKIKNINPFILKLMKKKKKEEIEKIYKFVNLSINKLYSPFLIYDMKKTIKRIKNAIKFKEKILIYGDYDVDGITSTVILKLAIEKLGGFVYYFIPNRFKNGYGPDLNILKKYIKNGISLIITVDNGINAYDVLEKIYLLNIDVIIIDHHMIIKNKLPKAYSIIHPRHPYGKYPFGFLAGVGITWKVIFAILGNNCLYMLDLVLLGTIADMVPLIDENRLLVIYGLYIIRNIKRIGLDLLISLNNLKKKYINEENISYILNPMLNSLGRLYDANLNVELLSCNKINRNINNIIKIIFFINKKRKLIVFNILKEAIKLIDFKSQINIIYGKNWNEGVLGIVASKILELTGKPTIILTFYYKKGIMKGSGRSKKNFNIYKCLYKINKFLIKFGGHELAISLTFLQKNFLKIKKYILNYIKKNKINFLLNNKKKMLADLKLEIFDITFFFIKQLIFLSPFGVGNENPIFLFNNLIIFDIIIYRKMDKNHIKFKIKNSKLDIYAIIFNVENNEIYKFKNNKKINIIGKISINFWKNKFFIQIVILDILFLK